MCVCVCVCMYVYVCMCVCVRARVCILTPETFWYTLRSNFIVDSIIILPSKCPTKEMFWQFIMLRRYNVVIL